MEDPFSKAAFGSSAVTVTVTTTGVDDAEEKKPKASAAVKWGSFSGEKNVKLEVGKSEKMLQRLRNQLKSGGKKSKKTAHAKMGGKVRTKKRAKGRTGAKERRRRK